jgi:hypothetical protein
MLIWNLNIKPITKLAKIKNEELLSFDAESVTILKNNQ